MGFSWVHFRLHFIVLLWGFTGVLGKLISIDSAPLVACRMVFGFVFLLLFLILTKKSILLSWQKILQFLAVGCIIAVHWLCFFGAIKASNVSVALSTLATGSLFSILIEYLVKKRKVFLHEIWLGIIVCICVGIIFFDAKRGHGLGIILGLMASFFGASFSVINAQLQKHTAATTIMLYELLGGGLLVGVVLYFMAGNQYHVLWQTNWQDWFWIGILGTLFTVYPMVESVRLMRFISPFTLLLTVNLEPVYGILIAFFVFGESERMNWLFYCLALVMILCIVANTWLGKRFSVQKKEDQ